MLSDLYPAAPLAFGPGFLERPTCQDRVHWEGQCSHYSYNEIIMNGAPRPHHRNIYCIIYSASPLIQGERTHINFQPCSSPLHSSSCLLLKAEALACLHSFIFAFLWELSIHWGLEALTRSGLKLRMCCTVLFFLICLFFRGGLLVFCAFAVVSFQKLEQLKLTKGLQAGENWDLLDAFSVFICMLYSWNRTENWNINGAA